MGSRTFKDISGFSLIELLVVISLVSISMLLAAPSFTESFERQRIDGIGDNLHFLMKLGKAEAAKKNTMVYVVFTIDATDNKQWCIGLSDSNIACDCNTADACAIDSIERVLDSTNYNQVALTSIIGNPISIRPDRGRSTGSTANFALNNKDIRLVRSSMGRDTVCSPSGTSLRYPQC